MEKKNENQKIELPCGQFCAKNCADGCIYWNPRDRKDDGRSFCESFSTYFYPHERNGCFRFQD